MRVESLDVVGGRSFALAVVVACFAAHVEAAPPAASKLLTDADLEGKILHELELMRAEPRARGGLVFVDWWTRDHFEKESWYRPGRYDEAALTDVARKNLATIERYLAAIPASALVLRWEALLARHRWAAMPEATGLAFAPDGRALVRYPLASLFGSGPGSVWNAATGELLARLAWPAKIVARGYFPTPFGPRLGTEAAWPTLLGARFAGPDLVVATGYHVMVGAPLGAQPKRGLLIGPNWSKDGGRDPGLDAGCLSPDGSTLVTLDDLRLKTFDLKQGRAVDTHDFTLGAVTRGPRCEFFDDTRSLVAVEHGGASYVWDLKAHSVTKLSVPRGMSRIASGGELLALWDVRGTPRTREVTIWDLRGVPRQILALAGTKGATGAWFTPDRKGVLVSGARGGLTLFDLRTGAATPWRGDTSFVPPGTLPRQPDSMNGQLFPILVEDAHETLDRSPGPDLASAVAFSPDGSRVAVAFDSGLLEMRDARTGARTPDFGGHEPWSDEETWEASLLARRLGSKLEPEWPKPPQSVNPLDHLAALDHLLPESALEPLSRLDLRLLRNAIAARRGSPFKAKTLVDSFAGATWYKPNPAYTTALLTAVDRANVRAIQRREAVLGGPLTEAEAVKHTEFAANSGMYSWQLLPQPLEPERTGSW